MSANCGNYLAVIHHISNMYLAVLHPITNARHGGVSGSALACGACKSCERLGVRIPCEASVSV